MIYIPLWLKVVFISMDTESLAWMQRCSFCAVYQGPKAKRRGEFFSWDVKNISQVTQTEKSKNKESTAFSLGYYTALQGVGSYWKSFTVLYIFTCIDWWHKERALQTIWYAWQWTFSECSCHGYFLYVKKKKRKGEYVLTQDKKPHLEDKSYEPAARSHNHAVTQPSTLAQMGWACQPGSRINTHGFESVADIIQQDG